MKFVFNTQPADKNVFSVINAMYPDLDLDLF